MTLLFYPPFRADDEPQLAAKAIRSLCAYAEDLEEFNAQALAEGWREVRRSHKTRQWPTINEIREACRSQAASRPSGTGPAQPWAPKAAAPAEAPRYQAYAEQNNRRHRDTAKAYNVDEGTLFRWLRDNGREPTDADWAWMRAFADRIRGMTAKSPLAAKVAAAAQPQKTQQPARQKEMA